MNRKAVLSLLGGMVMMLATLMLAGLGCILPSGCVRSTADLAVDASQVDNTSYTLLFYDDGGVVAKASIRVECHDNLCSMKVEVWHEEGTEMDSMSLEFTPVQNHGAMALVNPGGYSGPAAEFHATSDGGVIYTVPDLGFSGRGTVGFEFLLRKYWLDLPLQDIEIYLKVNLAMHKTGRLTSTVQRAEGEICLEIP